MAETSRNEAPVPALEAESKVNEREDPSMTINAVPDHRQERKLA